MDPHTSDGKGGVPRARRRRVLQATGAGALTIGAGALPGRRARASAQEVERTFELDGDASGWRGRAPAGIEGETNPSIELEAGRRYTISWTNADGFAHAFAIADADGDDVVGPTDHVSDEGTTQHIEFTATRGMATYYCSFHPRSMRGSIEIAGRDDDTDTTPVADLDVRRLATRDVADEPYERLYARRERRAVEALLADPAVNDVVADLSASVAAYDPHTGGVDSIGVQGSASVAVDGGIDEGRFDVTAEDARVAYGLVDRSVSELVALTITDPRDVSWTVRDGEAFDARRLRRVLEDSRVRERVEEGDWYPLATAAGAITSARGIEHGGVTPVALAVDGSDGPAVVAAFLDVRADEVGEVIDVRRVDRPDGEPPHELARGLALAETTVLEEVPGVPFERRPWTTANDGNYRIEPPADPLERSGWRLDWDASGHHGVELSGTYRETAVFERLDAPVTYRGYGLSERDGRDALEWFFPDDDSAFGGDALFWDVHSRAVGGPGPLGLVEYPETSDRPEGFRFRTHYDAGTPEGGWQPSRAGRRFGTAGYDVSYDFWADGAFGPCWLGRRPAYGSTYADSGRNRDVAHRFVFGVAMDATPGTRRGVEVHLFDGEEWTRPETEFHRVGEPGTILRLANPDGPEEIDLPLDRGREVVVVRRSLREIPTHQRLEHGAIESSFYHPAQYVGGESIQGERVIVWLLLEDASRPAGSTAAARATFRLSGY